MRYEVPAVIVLDAHDAQEAEESSRRLSSTLSMESGPGAFFMQGVAVAGEARIASPAREAEPVASHVQRLSTSPRRVEAADPVNAEREMQAGDGLGGDPSEVYVQEARERGAEGGDLVPAHLFEDIVGRPPELDRLDAEMRDGALIDKLITAFEEGSTSTEEEDV